MSMIIASRFSDDLHLRAIMWFVAAAVVTIVAAIWRRYLKKKRQQALARPEIFEKLKTMHKNGSNYEDMAGFLVANGVPRVVADEMIANLERTSS